MLGTSEWCAEAAHFRLLRYPYHHRLVHGVQTGKGEKFQQCDDPDLTGGSLGRKGRLLLLHAAVLLGLGALVWLYARGVLVCPVQLAFHLPCPTCGVTRALLDLAQGGSGRLSAPPAHGLVFGGCCVPRPASQTSVTVSMGTLDLCRGGAGLEFGTICFSSGKYFACLIRYSPPRYTPRGLCHYPAPAGPPTWCGRRCRSPRPGPR